MEITAGDYLFVDTNVFLIATDKGRDHHAAAIGLFPSAFRKGFNLGITGQIIREYLVVSTRPVHANGLGIPIDDALRNIQEFRRFCYVYDENENVAGRVMQLAQEYSVSGNSIHDTNIIAVMKENGISNLITENINDFKSYRGINVVNLGQIQDFFS